MCGFAGVLKSTDKYMNLQMVSVVVVVWRGKHAALNREPLQVGTEEWIDGALAGNLGEVLIRCNNVLFVRAANGKGEAQKKRRTEGEEDD
jgi:small nuclear ribonucleoprotein (snRNP)-like protein